MSILYLVTILVAFLFLYNLVKLIRKSIGYVPNKLPPGPRKLPFIGNMLCMVSSELPHHVLTNLAKKYGPLMHLQFGEISTLVVSSPRVAKEILVKHDLSFASRPQILATNIVLYNSTDIAFSPYGNYWRQMRKICTLELLSAKKVKSFFSIREEEVGLLLQLIQSFAGSPVNLSKYIFTLMNTITSRAAFGLIYKDQDLLVEMIRELCKLTGGLDVADFFPSYKFLHSFSDLGLRAKTLHQNLDKTLNNIIDEHKKKKKKKKSEQTEACKTETCVENFLDILFRLQNSGDLEFPITSDHIKAMILDVFSAGTDTSTATVEWAMSEMVRNPRVLKIAQAEVRQVLDGKKKVHETDIQGLKYLKLVIKETMRLHPSIPLLLPRECRESCEIDGYVIPVKTKVIINAWALARDPEYWHDAECFIPERFEDTSYDFKGTNLEYIPFGAGRRICPGILFGVANVEIVLASLLYHFKWELPTKMNTNDLDILETCGDTFQRNNIALHLIATPYSQLE